MSNAVHADTLALVDAMKSRGVRAFHVGDVRVEFVSEPSKLEAASSPAPAPAPAPAADRTHCACGHALTDHQNGMCVAIGGGCDSEACEDKET